MATHPQTGIKRNEKAATESKVLSTPLGDAVCWRVKEAFPWAGAGL